MDEEEEKFRNSQCYWLIAMCSTYNLTAGKESCHESVSRFFNRQTHPLQKLFRLGADRCKELASPTNQGLIPIITIMPQVRIHCRLRQDLSNNCIQGRGGKMPDPDDQACSEVHGGVGNKLWHFIFYFIHKIFSFPE